MESLLLPILSLAGLNLVALISPGPDFAVIVRNSLVYSRKTAVLTALGIALGILVHVSYCLLGLGVIIQEKVWLFMGIKYLGVSYLLYMGINGLRAKKKTPVSEKIQVRHDITPLAAIGSGFFTNALNPKCLLFFVSLFSVVVSPQTPFFLMLIYGAIIFVETLLWFSFVAFCLSGKRTRGKFNALGHWIERVTGGILMALGGKLLLIP